MTMMSLRICGCEQNYFNRHCRHVLPSEQKNFEKKISEHSTNSSRDDDSKFNLSVQFQLLQPNEHCYAQLLRVVFSTIHESALAKLAMLDFCLQLYANNNTLADIRNFAENYRAEDSAYWYTKESFVYRCVNQTLRSGDIDKCYSLRFYIANLSAQLHTLKYQQQKTMEKAGMTILYRGIRQSDEELNILQSLVGTVVAVKSFMSTSRNKDIALAYASPSHWQAGDSRPVLLEIHVDLNSPSVIAADITSMSNFDEENEVLFNIGNTFRVEMLTFDTLNNVWLCHLNATNENLARMQEFQKMSFNECLCQLILHENDIINSNETMRHEENDTSSSNFKCLLNDRRKLSWLAYRPIELAYIRHIDCIIQWQQTDIDKILNTYERVLEIYAQVDGQDSLDDLQIASCMNNFGYINLLCGKYTQLIDLFKSSLSIRQRLLPLDHILLAQSYRNLGLVYAKLRDYHTAFELHERALSINQHACIAAQWSTVTTLRNMGGLCHGSGNCTRAIEYFSKAMDTYHKCLNFF